jgi:hypothetical protein
MEKAQLAEMFDRTGVSIEELDRQVNAQMNYLLGRRAALDELLGGEISPEQMLKLSELRSSVDESVKEIEIQYRAQVNFLAGRKALLAELLQDAPVAEHTAAEDADPDSDPDSVAKGN